MNTPKKYEDVVVLLNEALAREAALREELETEKRANHNAKVALKAASETCELWKGRTTNLTHKDAALQQRLVDAERREEVLRRELKKLRDVSYGCYQIASKYSGCIDGVEEFGGDDHEDPNCAIYHRLYYAMFDADAALNTTEKIGKAMP